MSSFKQIQFTEPLSLFWILEFRLGIELHRNLMLCCSFSQQIQNPKSKIQNVTIISETIWSSQNHPQNPAIRL
jgi:hypothetical protein